MQTITTLRSIVCANCGIDFAINETFFQIVVREEKVICCPNGHEIGFPLLKPDSRGRSPEQLEEQRRRIQELHDQEQAEARSAHADEPTLDTPVAVRDGRRLKCSKCGKSYLYWSGMRNHLRTIHDITMDHSTLMKQIEAAFRNGSPDGGSAAA